MPSGKPIDWGNLDSLLCQYLPHMTITEFGQQFLPHISLKAIGARAHKIGITPKKYHPSAEHRSKIARAICKETPELIAKIKNLRDKLSRKALAIECKISTASLDRIIKKYKIKLNYAGIMRARDASRSSHVGKIPWNKGKKLPDDVKVKMAIGRQRQSGRISQLQLTFYRLLDELNITHFREDDEKCRFGFWTFDCRINHGEYDFLVEVQGDYIHSLPKNIAKDRAKATYMEQYFPHLSIKYVWEHEFGSINRVKQLVKQWLGQSKVKLNDFALDDIHIKPIDNETASSFLAAFHYLGKLSGRFKFGAYLGSKLIAASVWSAPTRIETATRLKVKLTQCLELRRFVIHDAYHKKNFASWLLARFEKHIPNNISMLVSFADEGVGHRGIIYRAANWKYDGKTAPSYFYVDEDGYVMLKKTLYNLAHRMHMSESDYIITYGYRKVFTPPKLRYIKCLLETYDDLIDQNKILYYSVKNPQLSLAFFLYNLTDNDRLIL